MLLSVLDILSKVVFGFTVLLSHEPLDRLVGPKALPGTASQMANRSSKTYA